MFRAGVREDSEWIGNLLTEKKRSAKRVGAVINHTYRPVTNEFLREPTEFLREPTAQRFLLMTDNSC